MKSKKRKIIRKDWRNLWIREEYLKKILEIFKSKKSLKSLLLKSKLELKISIKLDMIQWDTDELSLRLNRILKFKVRFQRSREHSIMLLNLKLMQNPRNLKHRHFQIHSIIQGLRKKMNQVWMWMELSCRVQWLKSLKDGYKIGKMKFRELKRS